MGNAAAGLAVVGNLNLDIRTGPLPPEPRVLADGETSVDEIYETVGGGGANTAVAAARMGGAVALCAAVGADALGERLAAALAHWGVLARLVPKPVATGRSIALNWSGHQRHFVSCLPSAALFAAADIDVPALVAAGCRHLYRADVWFAPLMLAEGNLALLREARRLGMATSIDVNWDPHWHAGRAAPAVGRRIAALARLLPELTYVHGNQRELCFVADARTLEQAADWYFAHGATTLVVHLGAAGCAVLGADGEWVEVRAERVDRVVCEAGTGDVFTAAFLLAEGRSPRERLIAANQAAARHLSGQADYLPRLPDGGTA